eukprot:GFKZ01015494.1.p1 GENE.GFKZ01015494.1~~GFKZ01015494.1.p1  ORF type:complete len:263 (+),score=35.54 GFKZ01015494.1:341-1129(+)
MSATTSGYRTIGTAAPASTPLADSLTSATVDSSAIPPVDSSSQPSADSTASTTVRRVQAVARGAEAAMRGAGQATVNATVNAKEAVSQLIAGPNPTISPNTEPLNPHVPLELNDRIQLVWAGCRDWSEFLDLKAFGTPEAAEVKLRVGHNVEVFFYNYLMVGMALLGVFALFHPIRALLLAVTIVAGMLLYILYPDDYVVTENFTVNRMMKHAVMAVLALLILTVGGVFALLFWVFMAFWPLVLLHAFLREHTPASTETLTV